MIKGESISTKDLAEKLAKENGMKIVASGDNKSELQDFQGNTIASDITIRLWHRVIELFKQKK